MFVVGNVPLSATNGQIAAVRLTGTAREAGVAATQGAVITETAGANTAGVDTVLADTKVSDGNTARDGIDFAEDDYTVSAAVLTLTKLSKVISDPLNNTTNPKMIPGAVVEYCIIVANAAGAATATGVNITDVVPAQTSFIASSIWTNSTITGGTCDSPSGTQTGVAYNSGTTTVSAPLSNLAASQSLGVRFQVTIN